MKLITIFFILTISIFAQDSTAVADSIIVEYLKVKIEFAEQYQENLKKEFEYAERVKKEAALEKEAIEKKRKGK